MSPFQGLMVGGAIFPGRCPGLYYLAPFRRGMVLNRAGSWGGVKTSPGTGRASNRAACCPNERDPIKSEGRAPRGPRKSIFHQKFGVSRSPAFREAVWHWDE